MDPASFSFAVVGMFLTCCKGYNILSDIYKAPSDAQDAARQVRTERAVLAGWGEYFEIRENVPKQPAGEKLKFFLRSDQTRTAVFDILCAISETFVDIKRLDRKYGIFIEYRQAGDKVGHSARAGKVVILPT